MDERELKDRLIALVQSYGSQWNKCEAFIYDEYEKEDRDIKQKYPGDQYHYAPRTDWHARMSETIAPLFDEYCTDKRRVYGGKKVVSFGFPIKFNGIEDAIETSVELKNKNRAEIYFKTKTHLDDEYKFILLQKEGKWKIDSYKNRRYGNEKWSNELL